MTALEEVSSEKDEGVPIWRLLAVGLIGGLLSGLLGIGGGTVMVPLLVLWLGLSQRSAHAVSLGAIIPISAVAVTAYGVAGEVDWQLAAGLIVGSIVGARLGATMLSRLPEDALKIMFGSFLLLAASLIVINP